VGHYRKITGLTMRKISRIIFTIAMVITGISFISSAQAQDSGSSGPVFLNKIKNIFSSDSGSNTQVAPLNPNRSNSRQTSTRTRAQTTQGMTLGEQRRQAWMARRQNTRQAMEQLRTEINQDIQNNYAAAQQFQANLQANGGGNQVNPASPSVPSATVNGQSNTGSNTRIVVPQNNEDNSGSKPVFKNYR